jgi:L-threonylcarbamoyladenylate synthase
MYLLRDDISEIVSLLEAGKTILYPTDTIWGLGCDATNEDAIDKISELKRRQPEKSYVILVDSIEMLKLYAPKLHPRIETLLMFHDRPLTVVYDRFSGVTGLPPKARAADGSAAIRVAKDPFCQKLIAAFGKPIISTSANISGTPFPAHFGEISSEVLSTVDYVVKFRQDEKEPREPSVIAKVDRRGELDFLRE